jgi:hypothetical protein
VGLKNLGDDLGRQDIGDRDTDLLVIIKCRQNSVCGLVRSCRQCRGVAERFQVARPLTAKGAVNVVGDVKYRRKCCADFVLRQKLTVRRAKAFLTPCLAFQPDNPEAAGLILRSIVIRGTVRL